MHKYDGDAGPSGLIQEKHNKSKEDEASGHSSIKKVKSKKKGDDLHTKSRYASKTGGKAPYIQNCSCVIKRHQKILQEQFSNQGVAFSVTSKTGHAVEVKCPMFCSRRKSNLGRSHRSLFSKTP